MNKIAFIFAHRSTDAWSTPLSIVREFESRNWEVRIYSLFDIYDNYVDTNIQRLIDDSKSKEFDPDLIMYMDWGRFDSPLLDKKLIPGAFWIMESGDDPQNFERNSIKADRFHLVLTPAHNSYLRYEKMGINACWWTHFADSNIHKPYSGFTPFDELPRVRSTRGPGGSQLMDYLSQIMPDKFVNKNGLSGIEYGDFLNSGLIVFQQSRWREVTRRLFEGMACGKLIITDKLPIESNIEDLFTENEHIVYYDSVVDCISKINYYLSVEGKEERERIAENGHRLAMQSHTQIQRVDTILRKFQEY